MINNNAINHFEEIKKILSVETDQLLDNLKASQTQSKNLLNGLSANVVMDNLKTEFLLNNLISNVGGIKIPEIYKGLDSESIMDDLISKFC